MSLKNEVKITGEVRSIIVNGVEHRQNKKNTIVRAGKDILLSAQLRTNKLTTDLTSVHYVGSSYSFSNIGVTLHNRYNYVESELFFHDVAMFRMYVW